jgi:methylmalonyl-CoA mutase N-terminal domain/subunit
LNQLNEIKRKRDGEKAKTSLEHLALAAEGNENLIPYILDAVEQHCTVGEISDALRKVWGEYTG